MEKNLYTGSVILAVIVGLIRGGFAAYVGQPCCFPDQFRGRLRFDESQDQIRGRSDRPFKFAVDFSKGMLCGEYENPEGSTELAFCADLSQSRLGRKQLTYIVEKTSKRCFKVPTSGRANGKCMLETTGVYTGSTELRRNELKFELKHPRITRLIKSDIVNPDYLIVDGGSCAPMRGSNPDHKFVFFDIVEDVGEFGRAAFSYVQNCDDMGDLSPNLPLINDAFRFLLDTFFPYHGQPERCCGPKMWQATVSKSIVYLEQNGAPVRQTTLAPLLSVDHIQGRVAGTLLTWTDGTLISNTTFLSTFGSTLMIYLEDRVEFPGTCIVMNVTDMSCPITDNCISDKATYEDSVNFGDSSNSIPLDVWQFQGNFSNVDVTSDRYKLYISKLYKVVKIRSSTNSGFSFFNIRGQF